MDKIDEITERLNKATLQFTIEDDGDLIMIVDAGPGDKELIAHAPEDIKYLLEQNAALKAELNKYQDYHAKSVIERLGLKAERDELKKALELALSYEIKEMCPCKDMKISVSCPQKGAKEANLEICKKCWIDWYIQQAKESLKGGQ